MVLNNIGRQKYAFISVLALLFLSISVSAVSNPYWYDTDWHFRTNYTINNSDYDRDYWPVELDINFTDLIYQENKNGTFDISSIRVIEQDLTGAVLFEHLFQFDNYTDFNLTTNAFGTLTFLLNGTTIANQVRYIYVYFDVVEYGAKSAPASFTTKLNYSWDGEEVQVNNSLFRLKIDTLKGESTSGIYDLWLTNPILGGQPVGSNTEEYTQLSNGTNNFSFDFRDAVDVSLGPIKLSIGQKGNETLWDDLDSLTGFGFMEKKYIFYENSSWIKIEQNYTNVGATSITRKSTNAGWLSFNGVFTYFYSFLFGVETNPYSWVGGSDASVGVGFVNLNYSSNVNISAKYVSGLGRFGLDLDTVTLAPNESIVSVAAMQFDGDVYNSATLELLRNQLYYSPLITQETNQFIPVTVSSLINYSVYNRNDSVLVFANITSDQYGIVSSMNATVDSGTGSVSDDVDIMLYDDGLSLHGDSALGDGIYSNFFNLSEDSNVSVWDVSVRAYDSFDVLLNYGNASFNVTDIYNLTINISNPLGIVERIVNVTMVVKNARQEYVPGAVFNCTYGAGQLTNITDFDNGTYILNFTAPLISGWYTLECNSTKYNNTGYDSQTFFAETSETTMALEVLPENYTASNISLLLNDSFEFSVNTTDIGGANAKSVNISLSLPANFTPNSTFESCGDILMGKSCVKDFNIGISNGTVPGNYTINVSTTWVNPNYLINSTNYSFIVYVLSNPILDVVEENVSGVVADGKTVTVGSFTVVSIGNDNITTVTFSVIGLSDFTITFNPENISSLVADSSQVVFVDVSVPQDYVSGNYSGIINVSAEDGGWKIIDLNVSMPEKTIISLQKSPLNYTSNIISLVSGEYFDVDVIISNLGVADAKFANITLSMPQNLTSNSTIEQCGRLNVSDDCMRMFNITIDAYTIPGNYTFNITSTWINPDLSMDSVEINFTVNVLSNPLIDVYGNVSVIVPDNSTVAAGNVTIWSIGNDNLSNITFDTIGLSDFTVIFNPVNVTDLGVNLSKIVYVNVSVPFAYAPGNYTGLINVSSVYGGYETVEINVTVPTRREWDITPDTCERPENPDEGTVCLLTVKNTGNVPINITVNSIDVNYTSVNETNKTILKDSVWVIEFLYNVTGVEKQHYYENYTLNTTNTDAIPQYYDFNITLLPYIEPLFVVNLSEMLVVQDTNIEVFVNITDRSTTGINWTKLNVTLPNGTVETFEMYNVSENGTLSSWYFNYSGNMSDFINYSDVNVSNYTGNTLARGFYNVTIYSQDNTGVVGVENSSFKIYTNLVIGFTPGSTKYYQGSTGSIYYTVTDTNGEGISGANVTITLNDPEGHVIFDEVFVTDLKGKVSPVPIFEITNDNIIGYYNFSANMTYYDSVLDTIVLSSDNATFNLLSGGDGGGSGLESTVRTSVVWYPDNVMNFEMWFSYAGNMTIPDNMTLTVYDPADNIYFNISLNDTNNTANGYYRYKYAMPMNSASGYYRAVLKATKEGYDDYYIEPFRVAKGGPYDVRVMIIPPYEVPRGEYVTFNIYVENMGEVTQDIYLDYWISSGNETYYRNEEAVLTPIGVNVTILRTAYIFSSQALGQNTLNVKATYDNVQAPIIATTTFEVIDEDVDIPPPPEIPDVSLPSGGSDAGSGDGGGSGDGSGAGDGGYDNLQPSEFEKELSINIETYNKEVNIVKGWTDISGIRVRNNGRQALNNIVLELTGLPSAWYNITPNKYETMPSGNSTLYLIEYKIPESAASGVYPFTLIANSDEISSDKMGRLIIFTSIEELIRQDIINLKIELHKLEDDISFSESLGKDVTQARDSFNQAWVQVVLAEGNVDEKLFDEALQNIQVASGLIKRVKMLLEAAVLVDFGEKESIWILALKALTVFAIFAGISIWWMRKNDKFKLSKSLHTHKKKALSKEEIEIKKKGLEHEKAKIKRVLKLLETESKEGILNKKSYTELKMLNDKKLVNIEKKIKKLG